MRRRPTGSAALAALALIAASCGTDVLGPPKRVKTDGFRSTVVVADGGVVSRFELAARGGAVRYELAEGKPWRVLVVRETPPRAFELDPPSRRFRELDPKAVPAVLPGFPLQPGFDEHREAGRRGLTEYVRESDAPFAGNACQIWRFDDLPDDPNSPSTTFWVAPSLDALVVRLDQEEAGVPGTRRRRTTELRNVRPGADPSLFEVPSGYRKDGAPEAGANP